MSDPLHSDPLHALDVASDPDRNAKIEQLLLIGLDHYFAAQFEQSINVWTRALFLDRNHARARAYIERARSALAERQRESEELLQSGLAAFKCGQGDEARRLLQDALSHGAPRDEALAVLDRLTRLEHGTAAQRPSGTTRAGRPPLLPNPGGRAPSHGVGVALSAVMLAVVAAAGLLLSAARPIPWQSLLSLQPAASQTPAVSAAVESSFPIPLRGETALSRARALAAVGHLHDALAALDGIRSTDAQKPEADALRADIQRQLIGLASTTPAPPGPARQKSGRPMP